ncbi:MAG: penicillin-binding protein [Patescibacteria group bacterium]
MKNTRELILKTKNLFNKAFLRLKNPAERKLIIRDAFLVGVLVVILISGAFLLWAASLKTPDLNSFDDRLLGQSAKIYDRTGTVLLYDLSQKVRRTVVPYDQISDYLKKATVAIEDADFYNHKGIKATSIVRAIIANILTLHFSQGGSTITQQVIKNSLLTADKDISRKLKEWILAIKLERVADKDTILDLYLNDTSYGGNIYGVAEASNVFFAKKPSELTLAEAAYLAALPQAPSYYSPYGLHKEELSNRKNLVLKKMLEYELITQAEFDQASTEEVIFQPRSVTGIKAPHFVMFIKQYLENKYGDELLQKGGFRVITTIDYNLQQKAEEIVKEYVIKNEKTFKASNGTLVATDPKTGQILVMVGSRDYFDKNIQGNFNVATAHRQPGSAFKPFVYATAFNKGFVPESPIYDVATEFNASCSAVGTPNVPNAKCYHPQNYEGGYNGLMTLRTALAQSRNVPAVRLLYMVGIEDSIRTARAMGIDSLTTASQYGLTLVLGGGEVSPLDMASSYGVFANDGLRNPYTGILRIEDSRGTEMEAYATSTKQVIPTQTARLMNDVLSDPFARTAIFGSRYFGDKRVAIKTGTTNNSRDAWIVGYTPNISVASWMGNNDNSPMVQKASATIVAPMWKQFMNYAIENLPDEEFARPEPTDPDLKPFLRGVWQGPGTEVHSELYWINKNDIVGDRPSNPAQDGLFRNFEFGVNGWAGTAQGQSSIKTTPPSSGDGQLVVTPSPTSFRIASPSNLSALPKDSRVTISLGNTPSLATKVDYYINGALIGTSLEAPFFYSFIPSQTQGIQDENELKAVVTDSQGAMQQHQILFSII